MKKNNYKKILAFVTTSFVFILLFCVYSTNSSAATTIRNPLGDENTDVKDLLIRIMNLVATAGGVVVVLFIIYSGFKFVTAGDSDSDRTKAKDMFYYTVIGGAILLGADVIANVVVNTVKATTGAR